MRRTFQVCCCLVGLALVAPAAADAADKFPTFTKLIDAGDDYYFQGEYSGNTTTLGRVGLQVIARGDGAYDAVLYVGGLPGDGWNRSEKYPLTGKREASILKVAGEGVTVEASYGTATLRDPMRRQLGVLRRVQRVSPTMGLAPPQGAVVLFNGDGNLAQFDEKAKLSEQGNLREGTMTKEPVGDFRLHLEFRLPYMPTATGQARGNSGVYIQQRYEVQVLDSFGLDGVHNECGGLYKTKAPDVNMCLPPLVWQTYDIDFRAARFNAAGQKISDARITVVQNGQTVQNNVAIPNKTGGGKPEGPEPLPILLQDHTNPVEYRNVWILRR